MPDLPRGATSGVSPERALHYSEHPLELLEDFPAEQLRPALRVVEREVDRWESQQTDDQRRWVDEHRPPSGVAGLAPRAAGPRHRST